MYGASECLLGCVLNAHLVNIRPVLRAVHVRNQTAVSSLWSEGCGCCCTWIRMSTCTTLAGSNP